MTRRPTIQEELFVPSTKDVRNLGVPVFLACCGASVAFGASMPKASINKNAHPLRAEDEILAPVELLVPPPSGDLVRAEDFNETKLG